MKKVLLGLLMLALVAPAMGTINITLTNGVGVDANLFTIKYACTAGEKVRAWALDVTVTDKALRTSTIRRQGLVRPAIDDANYYLTPTNASFGTVGNVLRVWNTGSSTNPYGSPAVAADANGFTIEMASLYAANDPCVAHRFGPPADGNLVSFRIQSDPNYKLIGCDGAVTIEIPRANAKRGGVVLENGTTTAVNLPGPLTVQFYTQPLAWLSPSQPWGDADGNGYVNAQDLVVFRKAFLTNTTTSPHGTLVGQYNCAADFDHNGFVNAQDLAKMRQHWLTGPHQTCGIPIVCP